MKITMKKSLAVILSLVMCVSVLFGMNMSAFAADANTVTYVYSGDYVYNWGQRGTTATFLSPMALEFYSTNGVTLDELLALNGSASESGVPSSALFNELHELMESNHDYITSYDKTKNLFQYTDCQNSGGKISSFYSGTGIGPSWNSNEWNREHVWPNSKGDKAGNGENDLMMLRPTSTSENSSRGNKAYGTTTTTQYYNPNDESDGAYDLRGDCARIILYQYVRWECTNTGSSYNPNSIFGANGVIESKKVLLDWIEADPVDTWELGRNDAAESILGTRNIFVDYPELAFDLLGTEIPKHQTPSGYANGNGTDDDVIVDEETGNEGNGGDSTGIEGGTITYEIIDGIENLTAGTYKMAAYCEANGTTNFSANPYHCFTGTVSSGDLVTNVYSFTNGNLTKGTPPDTKHTGDAVEVSLISVESKENTYYIYIDGKGYLYSTSAANRKLAFTNEPKEWVATNHTKGGITMTGSGVSMGSAGASSAIIRSYTNAGTLKYGLFFFKATSSESGSGGDQGGDEPDTPTNAFSAIANDDTFGTVTTNGNVVTVTPADGYKLSETEPYLVEGGEATVTDNGNGTYTISNVVGDATISFNFEATTTGDEGTGGGTAYYEKVTSAPANGDWSGQYLIVYETDKVAFNGALNASTIDAGNNVTSTLTIVDGKITADETTNAACFFIEAISDGYSIKSAGGAYIGNDSSSNGMSEHATTTYVNTISDTGVISGKGGCKLQFYKTVGSSGYRFRYYASSQQPVYLYKLVETGSSGGDTPGTPTYTVTANSSNTSHGTVTLTGNIITANAKAGYEISDYSMDPANAATVVDNGDGTFTVSDITADVTITINFVALPVYTVQFSEDGTLAEPMTKYVGGQITLPEHTSAVPDGYEFEGWAEAENETDYSKIFAAGSKYTVNGDITLYAQYSEVSSTPTSTVTIDFTTAEDRVSQSSAQQIWSSDGATVTNAQANGSSAVVADVNPAKFYAKSSLTIACSNMTQIVITASSGTYANVWATTLDSSFTDIKRVSVSGSVVTIEFNSPVNLLEIASLSAQTRIYSMEITKVVSSTANEYTVTYMENGVATDSAVVEENTVITLPNDTATPSNKNFVGWATVENATSGILEAGSSHTVTGDVTFYAQYTDKIVENTTHNFVKVTEDLTDWTGTYLIVYEEGNKAFNGSLTSLKTANGLDVSIADSKIKATDSALAASFTIEAVEGGYTIKSASGYYIGRTSANTDSNDLLFNQSTKYVNAISLSDGNVNIVGGNTYLRWNASSSFFRYYRSSTYTGQQPIALYKLDVADITGAQVTIGSDLTMKYYVDVTNIENIADGDLTMRFSIDGEVIDTVTGTVVGGQYVFDFAGLAPQRMADIIKAEVLYKGTLIDVKDDYSIKTNAQNLLTENAGNAKLCQFITDMLYYGAAAQKYTKYNTDALATSGVTGLGTPSTATPADTDYKLNLSASTGTANFRSATVWFDVENALIVKVNNPESASIKVTVKIDDDTETELIYDSSIDGYKTAGIKATDFATVYAFTLYENDTAIQTVDYSVNTYTYSKQNSSNANMANLALALYRFGQSAEAYAAQ